MKTPAGKTILITGATDGIGKITAHRLAAAGARVLVHGRSESKVRETAASIQSATGNNAVEAYVADLAALDNVRKLADEVRTRHNTLDVLINNAGLGFGKERQVSRDGFELLFAVNYLAPFLLTRLLLPALQKAAPSRIVNVASAGQHDVDFSDVMLEKSFAPQRAYRQSKLALIMFTLSLAEELGDKNVTVNSLHPGTYLNTKMVVQAGITPWGEPDTGAEAEMFLATSPRVANITGRYFDGKEEARALPQAYDVDARKTLWTLSEQWTGL